MFSTNFKLYLLTFIDSLCLAFLPPIMAVHVVSLGGNHTTLGIFGTIYATAQLFSGSLLYSCNGLIGTKQSLMISICIYLVTYYFLGLTTSCLVFIMLRTIFALTNQTQSLCKNIAATVNSAEITESVHNLMNVVGVAGLIVAPIISGFIFDYLSFYYVTLTASLLLVLGIGVTLTLPSSESIPKERLSFQEKVDQDIIRLVKNVCTIDFKKHGYLIWLKAFYTASLTMFFIKFSYALKLNQGISFTVIGLTYAYQSLVTFLSSFMINYFSSTLDEQALLRWLCISGISLGILCNTSSYLLYLGSFIMMAVAHGVLTRLFKELFAYNKIPAVEDSLAKVVALIIPTACGIACDFYGLTAYNAFVVLPIFCDVFIVYACIRIPNEGQEQEVKQSESETKKED